MAMFTCTARSFCSTLESMATPWVERSGLNGIVFSEVRIQQDLLPANQQDSPLDPLQRNGQF